MQKRVSVGQCAVLGCLLAAVAALDGTPVLGCDRKDGKLVNGSPGGGQEGPDVDGDGVNDMHFPNWRMPGDDADPPRCKLYCVSNNGRLPLFLVRCGSVWVHRCPYVDAWNEWEQVGGRYRGSSEEGKSGPTGRGTDRDNDGVVERVEYEEVIENGECFMIVRTYHDGVRVEPDQRVPCPERPQDLPWPRPVPPRPPAQPPTPPREEDTPVLPGAWKYATLLVGLGIALAGARRSA